MTRDAAMLVLWAMENCSQKEFKAISQNLGHENVPTTYNAYGKLSIREQQKAIMAIGQLKNNLSSISKQDLIKEFLRRS